MMKEPALWFSKSGDRLAYMTFNDSSVPEIRLPIYSEPDSFQLYTEQVIIRYPTVLFLLQVSILQKEQEMFHVRSFQPSSPIPRITLRVVDLADKTSVKDLRPPLSLRDQ